MLLSRFLLSVLRLSFQMALEGLVDVIRPDSHILDIGSGSGYLTTCFAKLAS
jgi:protein-L-isoaspartate O-methyltransferase